ncbi:MAG: ABC transporter substrate-binding protein [Thermoleophilia bacterium]|nr:ABC transporter substrate-binding protein [Thermoleophilia bacterium]
MDRKPLALLLLAVGALALAAAAAHARPAADPGVTDTTITIGGTVPLTGSFSSVAGVARGAEAYFKWLNAQGGVNKRKILYKYYDDQYNPSLTVQQTRQLVQQDKVFAIFNTVGTEHNLAIRGFLNELDVPHLFLATGLTAWGRQYKEYPWTMGYLPSYVAEGTIYGKYLLGAKPTARVAILHQDDDYGKDLVAGLRKGLGRRAGRMIVATETYSPEQADVRSEIIRLKASGANTLMIFAFGKFAIQSFAFVRETGWRPLIFVNQVASSANVMLVSGSAGENKRVHGALTIGFVKDPADVRWSSDRGMKLYFRIMKRYLPRANARDGYHAYGMASAFTMADALRRAGRNPTRASLIRAATNLTERNNPFLMPGIVVRTRSNDRFPIAQAQLQRFRYYKAGRDWAGRWIPFGKLVTARG